MKKEYKKPQVVEVKLTIQNPILGNCEAANPTYQQFNCNVTGSCAYP
jgi:hypothetical protein